MSMKGAHHHRHGSIRNILAVPNKKMDEHHVPKGVLGIPCLGGKNFYFLFDVEK